MFGKTKRILILQKISASNPAWRKTAADAGLSVRIGRWNIPGEPVAVLVDFTPFFERKNEIYGLSWQYFNVDSLHAYGDYDEASMFYLRCRTFRLRYSCAPAC